MAKFCTKCGAAMDDGTFCPECGYQAGTPTEQASQADAQAQQFGVKVSAALIKIAGRIGYFCGYAYGRAVPMLARAKPMLSQVAPMLSQAEKTANIHRQRLLIAALALLGVISLFMPWLTIKYSSYNAFAMGGDSGSGWLVFVCLAASLIPCILGDRSKMLGKAAAIAVAVCGAIPSVFIIKNLVDATQLPGYSSAYIPSGMFSVRFGFKLAAIICVAIVVVPVVSFILEKVKANPPDTAEKEESTTPDISEKEESATQDITKKKKPKKPQPPDSASV